MLPLPEVVTHYHRADRPPFLSLSEVPTERVDAVLAGLDDPGSRRRFGGRYLRLRRETEELLRQRFRAAGGRPERTCPHYFVLGTNDWFADLYDHPRAVAISLDSLPSTQVSVTLPDSITAMELGVPLGVAPAHPEHAGRVYRLDELDDALRRHDPRENPSPTYQDHQQADFDFYVEVQVWSDQPVRRWLEPESR